MGERGQVRGGNYEPDQGVWGEGGLNKPGGAWKSLKKQTVNRYVYTELDADLNTEMGTELDTYQLNPELDTELDTGLDKGARWRAANILTIIISVCK